MKLLTASFAFSALLPRLLHAISIAPRSSNPRALGVEFTRTTRAASQVVSHRSKLHKRQEIVEQPLDNLVLYYTANITLGTPPQALQLLIETGSSDLWVNTPVSEQCKSANGCVGGTYNANASSTYSSINNDFNITYADGSTVSGNYSSDVLIFGGISMEAFQFGVGEISTSSSMVLGIGYASSEIQVSRNHQQPYPNLPLALVNAGHIKSNAYSLWLNDLDADTGTILFGGVDRAKYQGKLVTKPILGTNGQYDQPSLEITGFRIHGQNVSSTSIPITAALTCGSTLTYLPTDIATMIFNQSNAIYDSKGGFSYAACTNRTSDSIEFDFDGLQISIPQSELILDPLIQNNGDPFTLASGARACRFGIVPANSAGNVLGDTFLRSVYVVYDLARNEISMAPTVFNATDSDIREIENGVSDIPSASASSTPTTSATTSSSLGASSSSGSSVGGSNGGGSNTGAIAGGVVGGVGGLAVIGVIIFFVMRRRRRRRTNSTQQRPAPSPPQEKAQLHSDDLKPQRTELEGRNAQRGLREDERPMSELPVDEEVGRSDQTETTSDDIIADELKKPDTGMRATLW